jgi:hypothetical protein
MVAVDKHYLHRNSWHFVAGMELAAAVGNHTQQALQS